MIDKNISRFCELVIEINTLSKILQKNNSNFYDGGHSFEECFEHDIKEISDLQDELKGILKTIVL